MPVSNALHTSQATRPHRSGADQTPAVPSLRELARALGGHVAGGQVLAPGPGHKPGDRSLAIKLVPGAPDGFLVHSHAGDDPLRCKDYVRQRLGKPAFSPSRGDTSTRPPGEAKTSRARIVKEYEYRDANGAPYLLVRRTENKDFYQLHWTGTGWQGGKPKGSKIPYRVSELLDAEHGFVFICEGEKDADSLAAIGLVATTNSEGAGKWTSDLNPYFEGRNVIVLPDNDEIGARHADHVAQSLNGVAAEVRIVKLPNLPPKGDVSDWIAAGGTAETLIKLCAAAPRYGEKPVGFSAAALQGMNFPPIQYVVPGYVVEGLTLLAGKPKTGKSWLCLDWAIAVAQGSITMGDVQCAEGDVLYCALEDNPRRLQKRMDKLIGMKAWPARLTFQNEMPKLNEGGVGMIRQWITQSMRPRLVVIDVLAKVRSSRAASDNSYEADYAAVAELKALAEEKRIAIVLVHHQRKMAADDPLDSVSGTTGLTGAVDTVMVILGGNQGCQLYARGRDLEEVDKSVRFDRGSCRWQVLGEAAEVRRTGVREKILEVMDEAGEPMTPSEIAAVLGASTNNIKQLLFKMAKTGEVARAPEHGHYILAGRRDRANADNR